MNTAMKTTFLSDQDLLQVQSILDQHGIAGFGAAVRLWGRGKAIEVKGTLGLQELSCLLAIARYLGGEFDHKAEPRGSNVVAMPLATPMFDTSPMDVMPQAAAA